MKLLYTALFCLGSFAADAQKISYSNASRTDFDFDIVGKVGNNYIVLKTFAKKSMLTVYDANMQLLRNVKLPFITEPSFKLGVVNYQNHFFVIYQVLQQNIAYCRALKMNALGEALSEPVTLDTASISFYDTDLVFKVNYSEDAKTILISKSLIKNKHLNVSYKLFHQDFHFLNEHREVQEATLTAGHRYSNAIVDNNGTIITVKSQVNGANQGITKLQLMVRKLNEQSARLIEIPLGERSIHNLKTEIDNINQRYIVSALYREADGNIKGLFTSIVNASDTENVQAEFNVFGDALRATVSSGSTTQAAFNSLKLSDIVKRENGGFNITMEDKPLKISQSMIYTGRRDPFAEIYEHPDVRQRDFLNTLNVLQPVQTNYLSVPNNLYRNLLIVELDSSLKVTGQSVVTKNQADERFSSFGSYKDGAEKFYLFSSTAEPSLINHYSVFSNGKLKRMNIFTTHESGHLFMLRYLKQVSPQKVLVPTFYKNRIAFALIDFSQAFKK